MKYLLRRIVSDHAENPKVDSDDATSVLYLQLVDENIAQRVADLF